MILFCRPWLANRYAPWMLLVCLSSVAAVAGDTAKVGGSGLRKLSGRHLILYTDLPASDEVDGLPKVFDQAFDQWCKYFDVDQAKHADWHATGSLIGAKERFQAAGMLPGDLPPFANGYSRGRQLWLYNQTSDYYRRHLLLHEGVHAFMNTLLGGSGPPWYCEGMAELLATHRLENERLTVGWFPRSKDEAPMLGRIKIVQDAYAAGHPFSLTKILAYDSRAHLQNEPYGWCWGTAAFLDGHPRYRDRFRTLSKLVQAANFNEQFLQAYRADWPQLNEEWQVFVANLTHGYDLERMAIDFAAGKPLAGPSEAAVQAGRGWQSSGILLEAGKTYRLLATGRYQVADKPRAWWCEPQGVTIRYHQGQPLGILLAAVHPDDGEAKGPSPLIKPIVVGRGITLTPTHGGTLYLRINDSPAELSDNAGKLTVQVSLMTAIRSKIQ